MSRKLIKGFELLEEILESVNEDGFIEIVDDEVYRSRHETTRATKYDSHRRK